MRTALAHEPVTVIPVPIQEDPTPEPQDDTCVEAVFGRRFVRAFTTGDCWHLALELRRLTGLPLVFFNPFDDDEGYWEHVGLALLDGQILDVEGVHTEADWIARWRDPAFATQDPLVIRASNDQHVAELVKDMDRQYRWSRVRAVARHLLDAHASAVAVAGTHADHE